MKAKSTVRVQRHRAKMRGYDCTRLEVTIGTDKAEALRRLSKFQGKAVWQLIEQAVDMLAAVSGSAA